MRQYARQVDQALRPFLNGVDVPLILAAAEPIATIFRSVNSYPNLAPETIPGNWETQSDAELAQRARAVLDRLYADQLREVRELYALRSSEHRAAADVAEVARAAAYGSVDTVLVDIDAVVPGSITATGAVAFGDADAHADRYGVVGEIASQ